MKYKRKKTITAKELIGLLPHKTLDELADDTNVNKSVKKLFGQDVFLLLLLSVLDNERVSLRVMEDLYKNKIFQVLANIEPQSSTCFTSLSDRLMNINSDYFEKIFHYTYETGIKSFKVPQLNKKNIIRFDSTSISASAKLLKIGMTNGLPNSKTYEYNLKQIKITIGFDGLYARSAHVFNEQKQIGEDIALAQAINDLSVSKNDIIVFDRGLKKRLTFAGFSKENKKFVTRINPNNAYEIIGQVNDNALENSDTLEFVSDQRVYLFHQDKKKLKVPFRLIKAINKETKQTLLFLTNIEDLSANEISEIYKARWDIEVFFRFLKQELNLKHFVSYSLNGIKVMLYVILVAALLIMLYKKFNDLESYKRAKQKFIDAIDTEITRIIVLLCGGDPNKSPHLNSS